MSTIEVAVLVAALPVLMAGGRALLRTLWRSPRAHRIEPVPVPVPVSTARSRAGRRVF